MNNSNDSKGRASFHPNCETDTCLCQLPNTHSTVFIFPVGKPSFAFFTHNLPPTQWKSPNLPCLFSSLYKMYPTYSIIGRKSPHILKISVEYIYFQLSIIYTARRKLNFSIYKSRETG